MGCIRGRLKTGGNVPDKKKSRQDVLTFYKRLFLLLYLATILFTVAIELVFVSAGKLTWYSFFLGLGGYTVAIAAIILTSYVIVLKAIARSEMDNTKLEEGMERYHLIVENMADVIWTLDMEFNRTYISPSIERFRGYNPEDAAKMNPDEIATPESLESAMRILAEELDIEKRGGADPDRSREFELEQYCKDGSTVWTGVTTKFLRDANGKPVGVLGVSRDIDDRKHEEDKLKRANAELDGFAHTVSHDLQGPLTAIRLANDILSVMMDEPFTESAREDMRRAVQIVDRNIDSSSRLIKDLLALAKAGQVPDSVSSVAVSEVVARVLDENAGSIEDGGVDVTVDDDLGWVTTHPTHVYQVFSNLIGNAIKHNDNPNPQVSVTLLESEDGNHRYLVKDNGLGIPPGDLDKVFTPFFKGKSGETGIGLATVKKIVRTNGWEIRAYNDNGANFELTF